LILHSLTDGEYPQRNPDFRILSGEERDTLSLRDRPDRREALEDIGVCLTSGDRPIISLHRAESDKPVAISTMLEGLKLVGIPDDGKPRSRMEVLRLAACAGEDTSFSRDGKVRIVDAAGTLRSLEGGDLTWQRISERADASGSEGNPYNGRILDQDLIDSLDRKFGPEHVWSASRLETYRKCPYEFFVKYVLGIKPLETLDPEVPPDLKGRIIHSILEGFYTRWKQRGKDRVSRGEEDQAFAVITASAREVIGSYSYQGPFWDALSDLLIGAGGEKGILEEFIETEASYEGPFTVEGMEVRFGKGTPAKVDGTEGSFLIEGIVDRIDAADAMRMIWDYKSGSSETEKDSLQVPLYLAALKATHPEWRPAGGGYYRVGKRGLIKKDLILGDDLKPDLAMGAVRNTIVEKVDESYELIEAIRSGMFTLPGSCPNERYCEFSDICRRDE